MRSAILSKGSIRPSHVGFTFVSSSVRSLFNSEMMCRIPGLTCSALTSFQRGKNSFCKDEEYFQF